MGECQHCYAHRSSYLSTQGLYNSANYVFFYCVEIIEGGRGGGGVDGHLLLIVLLVGVGLNGVGAMLRKEVSGAKWMGEVAGPWGESG